MSDIKSWDESLRLGLPQLDYDHKNILELADDYSLDSIEARILFIDKFLHYVTSHLRYEEDFMATRKYPGLPDHRKDHQKMITLAHRILPQFAKGQNETLKEFLDTFKSHILTEDKKLAEFLRLNPITYPV
jgi:hemerythrin-like metal-binding protein